MKPTLTVDLLCDHARKFSKRESAYDEPAIYGVNDGKSIGTYFEHKFRNYLERRFHFDAGNSAKGIDFPDLNVDMKVTSVKQPQSSCPYRSARQKVYGLGYSLLVFVYDKSDDEVAKTGRLNVLHAVFVDSRQTGDFQTTTGLLKIIENDGNVDDIVAFIEERRLPVDEIQSRQLAEEVLANPPRTGYLTITSAFLWRLRYARIIDQAGLVDGVVKIR